jgi:hypothetical protein
MVRAADGLMTSGHWPYQPTSVKSIYRMAQKMCKGKEEFEIIKIKHYVKHNGIEYVRLGDFDWYTSVGINPVSCEKNNTLESLFESVATNATDKAIKILDNFTKVANHRRTYFDGNVPVEVVDVFFDSIKQLLTGEGGEDEKI